MKIFNWVHRRFNHKGGMVAQNERKTRVVSADDHKQCMFDAWKGGILTIGTFGYDPLPQNGVVEEEKGRKVQSDDFLVVDNTVIDQTVSHNCEDGEEEGDGGLDGMIAVDESEEEEVNPLIMYAAAYVSSDYSGLLGMEENSEKYATKGEVTKKERRTLAELFSSEWEEEEEEDDGVKKGPTKAIAVKQTAHKAAARRMAFAKKILGEDARPTIHKLNRLMRRMLNRKIHPDDVVLAAAHNPNPNPTSSTNGEVVPKKQQATTSRHDTAS